MTPAAPPFPSPGEALALAGTAWGLCQPALVADLGGSFNRNLRLRDGDRDLVLRLYRPYVGTDRLAAIRTTRDRARAAGLPVPPTIATADGAPAATLGGCLAELEPWVSDDGGTDDWSRAEVAGGLLGRLHHALAPSGSLPDLAPPPVSTAAPDDVLADWLGRTGQVIAASDAGDTGDRMIAARAVADARRLLDRLASVGDRAGLPRQVTHGDYGHANLRFAGQRPVALLDFDFSGVRPRAADLADLAFAPHWVPTFGQADYAPAAREHDRVAALITAYDVTALAPLTTAEVRALPALMARLPVAWVAMGWLMADPVAAVAALAPEMPVAAWHLDEREALADRWLSLAGSRPS